MEPGDITWDWFDGHKKFFVMMNDGTTRESWDEEEAEALAYLARKRAGVSD